MKNKPTRTDSIVYDAPGLDNPSKMPNANCALTRHTDSVPVNDDMAPQEPLELANIYRETALKQSKVFDNV